MIDAHCHLTDLRIEELLPQWIEDAEKAGIKKFILGGIEPEEWDRQLKLQQEYPERFYCTFGFHPWKIDELARKANSASDIDETLEYTLSALKKFSRKGVGIGETGLDFTRDRRQTSGSAQLQSFQEHVTIAQQAQLPLVLHVVKGHEEALKFLKLKGPRANNGLVHSFSGTWQDAQRYCDLGFLISISAKVTYSDAVTLQEVVKKTPFENLVIETDSPDQPPSGFPAPLHPPKSLILVADAVAKIRGCDRQDILDQNQQNLVRVFSLK